MRQVQWRSFAGLATVGGALIGASLPAEAAQIAAQTEPFSLIVPAAQIDTNKKCITVGDQEFCLVNKKKKKSGAPDGQTPSTAPQGGNGAPQGNAPGQAGGGNAAPPGDAGVAGGGNAAPPGGDTGAKTATEPGERSCPEGYVVLSKPNKFGAFCEPAGGLCPKGQLGTPPNCTCPEGTVQGTDANAPCIAKPNCPFPEMTGNGPDCKCPEGTALDATKGCVKLTLNRDCKVFGKPNEDPNWYPFMTDCVSVHKSKTGAECQTNTEGTQQFCCCTYYTE